MRDLRIDLPDLLRTVTRPGGFSTHGRLEAHPPSLEVKGVGRVPLPLVALQVPGLVAVAERAPYGKGQETRVDTSVRRTWQIAASRVTLGGRHWAATLDDIVARAALGLGAAGKVRAELYKLLVYDDGSFFVGHRDTEKAAGMFATLVVVLPSEYQGGELVVRHEGHEEAYDLRTTDLSEVTFAAFYADCLHEVKPVTKGCRLVLVYNLLRSDKGATPRPPSYDTQIAAIAARFRSWGEETNRIVYPLSHAYTPAELSLAALKNGDAAIAPVLFAAAEAAACEVALALLTIEESGSAENEGGGWHRRRRSWGDDGDDFTIGEVFDSSSTLGDWRRADGTARPMGVSKLRDEELSPPDAFKDAEPEALSFSEATGNEGASFERTYRRAAVVIWPEARALRVIAGDGPATSVPYLAEMDAAGRDPLPLAREVIAAWPLETRGWRPSEDPAHAAKLLELLCRKRAAALIALYFEHVVTRGPYDGTANELLVRAALLLPRAEWGQVMAGAIEANAAGAPAAVATLFRLFATAVRAKRHAETAEPAVCAVLACLPGCVTARPSYGRIGNDANATVVREVLQGCGILGDEAAADEAANHIFARQDLFPEDAILVPAVIAFLASADARPTGGFERVRTHCVAHLKARIAQELAPPPDFTREGRITCNCADCAALGRFLSSPREPRWEFRAAKPRRAHISTVISSKRLDLDTETLERGSPHGLLCTKNQRSYDRRVAQRAEDLTNLAVLARGQPQARGDG